MSEESAFQKSRVTPPAPRCQCRKSLLLPGHLILLAPIERDLSQGPGAICVPRCLDSVPTKRVLEPSEGPPTMNSRNKVSANGVGFHRTREILHDCPLVHLKLRRQFQEAPCRNDPPGDLLFLFLPSRQIRFLTSFLGLSEKFVGLSEKFVRDSLYVARVRIQEGGGLFELYLQSVDDLLKANRDRHASEIILISGATRQNGA